MTLEEKLGQMFMIGIQGTDVDEESLFMLHQYHIGGIILFDRNMKTQEQVK
jgi:beta-N-acetylhexosaminidase